MKPNVKTLLFGTPEECVQLAETLGSMEAFSGSTYEYRYSDDMEEFERILVGWMPSLVIVLADGASGMESVIRSRQRRPSLPVFWFSDDRQFGMQSYRLECAYFSTKPVTPGKLECAVKRCEHIGISYAAPETGA